MNSVLSTHDVTMLPDYWGRWFVAIGGGTMKQTDLNVFFLLGAALEHFRKLSIGMKIAEVVLTLALPEQWLDAFLKQTEGVSLPDSRTSAKRLHSIIVHITKGWIQNTDRTLAQGELWMLDQGKNKFVSDFARECKNIDVFTVTPKGLYSTRALIEAAETKFPENLLKVMPQQTIQDLKEAGRCLAFEVPTACAFYVCRATEALMLRYYEVLAGQAWSFPRRDWYNYNTQLAALHAPPAITNRLGEIRADRNAYAHPEITVPLDEAIVVFDLCNGVIHLMAKEIERLTT